MNSNSVEYRELSVISPEMTEEMTELYRQAGWLAPEESGAFIPRAMAGSTVALGVFDGSRLIGMGRAVSDGVSDAYIQDNAVSPDYRKRGIGGEIVRHIVAALRARGIDWIGLVGEPGTEHFYEELGFTRKPGYTLWKL